VRLAVTAILACAASGSGIGAAVAGESAADAPAMEEVVVTSQRRNERLQDAALTVQAVTEATLESAVIGDTSDLALVIPGMTYTMTASRSQPYIRGIGTRAAFIGLDSSVATYVDDMYLARPPSGLMDLTADIERIEVLKGPQGTLYGRNSTGGAIRIITKRPKLGAFEGVVMGTLGRFNQREVSGSVNVPMGTTFAMRFAGAIQKRDGMVKNTFLGTREGDRDTGAARMKALWNPTDAVEVFYGLDYQKRNGSEGAPRTDITEPRNGVQTSLAQRAFGGQSVRGRIDEVASDFDPFLDLRQVSHQLRVDFKHGGYTFSSVSTYSDYDTVIGTESDGTTAHYLSVVMNEKSTTFSQEFQVVSPDDRPLRWIAGVNYYDDDGSFVGRLAPGTESTVQGATFRGLGATAAALGIRTAADVPVDVFPGTQIETKAWAAFASATYDLTDKWSATAGARYSHEERAGTASFQLNSNLKMGLKDSWRDFSPSMTLERKLEHGLAFVRYSRGFKSGGFDLPVPVPSSAIGALIAGGLAPITVPSTAPSIDPEVLHMVELGLKLEPTEKLRVNTTAYAYDYSHLQIQTTRPSQTGIPTIQTENAGKVKLYGLESTLEWRPTRAWGLQGGVNVQHSRFSQSERLTATILCVNPGSGCSTGPLGTRVVEYNANGDSLVRVPKVDGFVSTSYDWQLGSAATLTGSLLYSYRGATDFQTIAKEYTGASGAIVPVQFPAYEVRQKAYGLLNGRISGRSQDGAIEVALWGSNLTNRLYLREASIASGQVNGSYGPPRTYGLDMTYRF
jgi:iron complex outermembrane receptor protein